MKFDEKGKLYWENDTTIATKWIYNYYSWISFRFGDEKIIHTYSANLCWIITRRIFFIIMSSHKIWSGIGHETMNMITVAKIILYFIQINMFFINKKGIVANLPWQKQEGQRNDAKWKKKKLYIVTTCKWGEKIIIKSEISKK